MPTIESGGGRPSASRGLDHELAKALGHLRQTAHQLMSLSDPSGRALLLAAQVLDLGELLGELEVDPTFVSGTASAATSLAAASRHLVNAAPLVPSSVWPALHDLQDQVRHGLR